MMWQDFAFAVGNIVFLVALLPVLFDRNARVPRTTSVMTASVLFVFAGTAWSLNLIMYAYVSSVSAVVWGLIAWKRGPTSKTYWRRGFPEEA